MSVSFATHPWGLLQNAFLGVQDPQMRVHRWTRRPNVVAPRAVRALLQHAPPGYVAGTSTSYGRRGGRASWGLCDVAYLVSRCPSSCRSPGKKLHRPFGKKILIFRTG